MKKCHSLWGALALSALGGSFFQAEPFCLARYAVLSGGAALFLLSPLLYCASGALCHAKEQTIRAWLAVLLFLAAVQDAARLCQFYQGAYPQRDVVWTVVLLAGAGTFLFARGGRDGLVSAAQLLWPFLAASLLILFFSLAGNFRLVRLETGSLGQTLTNWRDGLWLQFALAPEYLLLATMSEEKSPSPWQFFSLVAVLTALRTFFVLVSELCVGQALHTWPLYRVACLGQISVFSRLDIFQTIVFTILLLFRFGLYADFIRHNIKKWGWLLAVPAAAGLAVLGPSAQPALQALYFGTLAVFLGGGLFRCKK